MTYPRFDPTFNLGHIFTTVAFVGTLIGVYAQQSSFQTRTEERLAASELARVQYIPIINDIAKIQAVTNDQLGNLRNALIIMQTTNEKQVEATSHVRERLSAIEAKIGTKLP